MLSKSEDLAVSCDRNTHGEDEPAGHKMIAIVIITAYLFHAAKSASVNANFLLPSISSINVHIIQNLAMTTRKYLRVATLPERKTIQT